MEDVAKTPQPLKGFMVVELGTMITAPLACMMLADLGADVVKIEQPKGGDPFRSFRDGLYSPNFVAFNHSKRSIRLDLRQDAGRAVLTKLIARSDVLVENNRPGVLGRLGFPPEKVRQINPRIVQCSITGFGATGPYSERPAFDTIGQALSGLTGSQINPEDPQIVGPTVADYVTGMQACCGILAALNERNRTGVGRRVEVNLLEASMGVIGDYIANLTQVGIASEPLTRTAASQAFAFSCADGRLVAVHLSRPEKFWTGLLAAIERPDLGRDARFATRALRIENYPALRKVLGEVFATRPIDDWMARLQHNDVPFAPINSIAQVCEDPQVAHLRTMCTVEHPTEGAVVGLRSPILFDGERLDIRPPPTLGEHSGAVLEALGYSEQEIAALQKAVVI